jgi:BMFP domain-containing protein YqiC
MTADELAGIVTGIAPVLKSFVERAIGEAATPVLARIEAANQKLAERILELEAQKAIADVKR